MEQRKLDYLNEHVDDFRFDLYLTHFDFRNKVYAQDDFKKLIEKIIAFKCANSRQEVIQLANRIKGENYAVFASSAAVGYWEEVSKEIRAANARARELSEREERSNARLASTENRLKRRAQDEPEGSSSSNSNNDTSVISNSDNNSTNNNSNPSNSGINNNNNNNNNNDSNNNNPRLNEIFQQVQNITFPILTQRMINNNCLDLTSDIEGTMLYYLSKESLEEIKEKYPIKDPKLPKLQSEELKSVRSILKKKNQRGVQRTIMEFHKKSLQKGMISQTISMYCKVIQIQNNYPELFGDITSNNTSEADYIIKAWAPLINMVFEDSHLRLCWGDTKMENTDAPFKVDLRVTCTIDNKAFDVGFGEFARSFTSTKANKDRVKLIMESKETINIVFKSTHNYIPDVEIYSIQIAGLKGHLISTTLQSDGLYTANNVGKRIRFPLNNEDIYDGTQHLIRSIIKFKEQCLRVYDVLEAAFTIKNQERLSFEGTLNKRSTKKHRTSPLPLTMLPVPDFCTSLWLEANYEDE